MSHNDTVSAAALAFTHDDAGRLPAVLTFCLSVFTRLR